MNAPDGSWFHKLPPNHYQYAQDTQRKVERDGILYQLHLTDYVHWRVFWDMEKEGKNSLFHMLKPGDCFMDIGANIGEICLKASRLVGASGKVFAFEPIAENMAYLRRNVSQNPDLTEQLQLFEFALGAENREFISFIHPRKDNFGMIRIREQASKAFAQAPLQTLDAVLVSQNLTRLDGIKLDVEGYELKVLQGAEQTILRHRPWLFIEVDDTNLKAQGDSAPALFEWLKERDYRIKRLGGRAAEPHGDVVAMWEGKP